MNKLFILLLSIVIFASCSKSKDIEVEPAEQKRPFVDFEAVPGDDPFTFDFKNNSKEYKKLEWRFGDDSVSYETTPKHIFASAGTFEVNLTAIAEDGSTAKKWSLLKLYRTVL
ncbi:PKD domain-containing protein [Pedobacter panaciterrae]